MFLINNTLKILISQAVWATGQAGLVFILSLTYGLEAVADYILALAIYTPIALFFSKNSRNLLAVDANKKLDVVLLLRERVLYSVIAFIITGILIFVITTTHNTFLIVLWLILARVSDQIADVCFGFYQRENLSNRIAWSQLFRGIGSVLLIIVGYVDVVDFVFATALYAVIYILIVLYYDVLFILKRNEQDLSVNTGLAASFNFSALYPFLDTIHLNSLRYFFVFLLTKQELGYLGLAQTLYMPVQLFITACGFLFITHIRDLYEKNKAIGCLHVLKGMMLGALGSLIYILFLIIIPVEYLVYVFPDDPGKGREYLICISIIMAFFGMSGFISQILIVQGKVKKYSRGPSVGIIIFILSILIFYWNDFSFTYKNVLLIFGMSAIVRFFYVLFWRDTGEKNI